MTEYEAVKAVIADMYEHEKTEYLKAVDEQLQAMEASDKDADQMRMLKEARMAKAIRKNILKTLMAQLDDRVDCKMKGLDWYPKQ